MMKFSISSQDLLKHLNKSAGAISSNPVLPILEDFLFSIDDNVLTITATNLETSIISSVEVHSDGIGIIAVPAKILLDTLKALPDQPITFTIDEETNGIEITSAYGKYKLAGDNPEDFPEIPKVDSNDTIELDVSVVTNALNKSLFATSSDELRLAMTGVYFQVDFNKITFVATDAHKLVKYTYSGISTDQTGAFIIPKKSLSLLKAALPSEGTVHLSHNNSNAFFSIEGVELICRLIDTKYPDYNAVIPVDNPHSMIVRRVDFQNSLKRIAIYANKTTNQVALNINDGSLTISAQDLDFSNEATEQLTCEYTGEPLLIGFNARFLIEMLSVLDTDEVKFELSTPNRAGIMVPTEIEENEDLLMLVMPVMMGT
jgi:DNA polymerase-3 subunit beta